MPRRLSTEHRALLTFAILQRSRTTYAAEQQNEMMDKVTKAVFGDDPRVAGNLEGAKFELRDPLSMPLRVAARCAPLALDLSYRLLVNHTRIPLIASDNPVVFYNQFLEWKKALGGITGVACKGLQIFLPLSPRHVVVFFDGQVYRVGSKRDRAVHATRQGDILRLNELQCINAHENIYFNGDVSEGTIRAWVSRALVHRARPKANVEEQAVRASDGEHAGSLLIMSRSDIRCGLSLTPIKIRKKAKRYQLGSRAVHVRDEEVLRELDRMGPLAHGPYRISNFGDFLRDFGLRRTDR